jgi:phenylacetate-CoA ligase
MIRQLASRIYGSGVILAHLRGQRRAPFRSREEVLARRDAAVRRLVMHAASTVPYYGELFSTERIDPREIRTAEDLARLPLLEKSTVRRDPRRFLSDSPMGRTALPFVTSGTTGAPLQVWHDHDGVLANMAYGERERAVILRTCGAGLRPRELAIARPGAMLQRIAGFCQANALLPARPRRTHVSVLDPLDHILGAINSSRPHVLVGYGGFLELLFRYADAKGVDVHRPRMIIYVAETMTAPARRFIEERFGVPIFSRYNAVEAFKIGFVCEERAGFHVHEDLCHVRVVRRSGEPAPPGEQGEIVISNLVNQATVLLNYRMGDLGSWSPEPCACGRSLGRLRDVDGRNEDILYASDGGVVHPRAVWAVLKELPGLLQYQLVQTALDGFELRLMTSDRRAYEEHVEKVVAGLRALLGVSARVEHERVESLEPRGEGKFRAVIRRFEP